MSGVVLKTHHTYTHKYVTIISMNQSASMSDRCDSCDLVHASPGPLCPCRRPPESHSVSVLSHISLFVYAFGTTAVVSTAIPLTLLPLLTSCGASISVPAQDVAKIGVEAGVQVAQRWLQPDHYLPIRMTYSCHRCTHSPVTKSVSFDTYIRIFHTDRVWHRVCAAGSRSPPVALLLPLRQPLYLDGPGRPHRHNSGWPRQRQDGLRCQRPRRYQTAPYALAGGRTGGGARGCSGKVGGGRGCPDDRIRVCRQDRSVRNVVCVPGLGVRGQGLESRAWGSHGERVLSGTRR
jgi:hypothetical protein